MVRGLTSPGVALTAVLAAIAGALIAVFLDVADDLPRYIGSALAYQPESPRTDLDRTPADGIDLVIVHQPPGPVARGMQLGMLLLLSGSIPAAILAAVLAHRTRRVGTVWPAGWASFFHAGFLFQLAGLACTSFLLAIVVTAAAAGVEPGEILWVAAPLALFMIGSIPGLRSWRILQDTVDVKPERLTGRDA
jgi:hypothetical protein